LVGPQEGLPACKNFCKTTPKSSSASRLIHEPVKTHIRAPYVTSISGDTLAKTDYCIGKSVTTPMKYKKVKGPV